MGLLIDGASVDVPGLLTLCPLDHGGPPHTPHVYRGNGPYVRPITGIVVHSSGGIPTCAPIDTLAQHDEIAWANARYYGRKDSRPASAHAFVGECGTVLCLADMALERTWHASGCDPHTIGIEMAQTKTGGIYDETYAATALLVAFLCEHHGIPKRIVNAHGVVPMLDQDHHGPAGKAFHGVWGHRNSTRNRNQYDPGDVIFERLAAAGFETVTP